LCKNYPEAEIQFPTMKLESTRRPDFIGLSHLIIKELPLVSRLP
jgi:hypothetical protein